MSQKYPYKTSLELPAAKVDRPAFRRVLRNLKGDPHLDRVEGRVIHLQFENHLMALNNIQAIKNGLKAMGYILD
jgi:hypothetical protein